jgi:putative nucleotidyltransferase with HDIG domain
MRVEIDDSQPSPVSTQPTNAIGAPSSLVKDVAGLVSPPDICMRIFELLQSSDSSAKDIGEVIVRDPNLTARLLKIVNSPFYGFSRKVDTVSRAIAIVGIRDLYNLVIAVSAVRSFSNIANDVVNMDTFWRHSMFSALVARKLAKTFDILHPERLFIAGLLHDIGSLVLYNRLPEVMRDILLVSEGDEQALWRNEKEQLGFSHTELGALLLELWNIPESLQNAVSSHHDPTSADAESMKEACIIHLADSLANHSDLGNYSEMPSSEFSVDPSVWSTLGIDGASFDAVEIIGDIGLEFTESAAAMLGAN